MTRADGPPMTLGNMRLNGARAVYLICGCGREATIGVDVLADDIAVPSLRSMFRCRGCGARPKLVRPAWHDPRGRRDV